MKMIVVGYDGSDSAERAARTAADLARRTGATLHVVTAVKEKAIHATAVVDGHGERWAVDGLSTADDRLSAIKGALGSDLTVTGSVNVGDPADALIEEAERLGADVIVVGNRRVQGLSRVLGAVALDVVRRAPCHVLIAKTH